MNIYDVMFTGAFLVFLIITVLKIWNIMALGTAYDIRYTIIHFVLASISMSIMFVVSMLVYVRELYLMLFLIVSLVYTGHAIAFVIELLLAAKNLLEPPIRERYNPQSGI